MEDTRMKKNITLIFFILSMLFSASSFGGRYDITIEEEGTEKVVSLHDAVDYCLGLKIGDAFALKEKASELYETKDPEKCKLAAACELAALAMGEALIQSWACRKSSTKIVMEFKKSVREEDDHYEQAEKLYDIFLKAHNITIPD
jgi:hypothetical protein